MTSIPIYNTKGIVVNTINIDDNIIPPLEGRVSKGDKVYYKGLGVNYSQHHIDKKLFEPEVYDFVRKSDIFYLGYVVKRKNFIDKFGIFQETFQPMFTDHIGTCGVKELSIIENSLFFEKTSAEVIKSVRYDTENNQYYFVMNYTCGRRRYVDEGDPIKLRELLDYTLSSNWNFIWDKNSITDISYNGLVTDVGELFISDSLENKLGSVYSVLYSLGKHNFDLYLDFCRINGLVHINDKSYIYNSVDILNQSGVDTTEMMAHDNPDDNYKQIVLNYLLTGRNCGHCSLVDVGEQIKEAYINRVKAVFENDGY
jgi:hypothetical protein